MIGSGISEQYRLLAPEEVSAFALECGDAWKNPALPQRQYDLVVAGELKAFGDGKAILPYEALLETLRTLQVSENPTLLDVGCASGYYFDVLRLGGFPCRYRGIDFSEGFIELAKTLFGGSFSVQNALAIEEADRSFEIVLHGACLMHLTDWGKAINEAVRVSSRYVIFHRTAIVKGRPTQYWAKEAYGVPCLEVHYEHDEFLKLCEAAGLKCLAVKNLFFDEDAKSGHFTFVMQRV